MASARLVDALATATRMEFHRGHFGALITLSYAKREQGEPQAAYDHAGQALALARESGSVIEVARAQCALAAACLSLADLEQCISHAEQALHTQQRAGQQLAEARTMRILARARELAGR
jgi:tetratricopeptide (TPR) repeat protein